MAKAEITVHIADLPEVKALVDALAARLAAAEKVVEAAESTLQVTGSDSPTSPVERLRAAVNAYRTHEPEPEPT